MGEVYRARDTKLARDVAIKILPAVFADDLERTARFQREAQLLAALNHPHIAAIYGLEDAAGTRFLVLELVEGETLADLIARGPLPLDDALRIAAQVADALESAHEKAIVHRDLKPGNIALTHDGQVKVLDFGLAKALDPLSSAGEMSMSPTLSLAATRAGVILGTAAYMSPEQARGRGTDKRTDVWAFGCVLYEMLAGKRAFEGDDVTDIIAAVVRAEPDWAALPSDLPEQIRLLIRRCLDKDRRTRISDIAVARFLMAERLPPTEVVAPPMPQRNRRRVVVVTAAAAILGAAIAGSALWALTPTASRQESIVTRFSIVPPAAQPLSVQGTDRDVAISPDGKHIVYRSATPDTVLLVIRDIGELDARPLTASAIARGPFFSPDGQWVGFAADDLRKISVTGGPPFSLTPIVGTLRGASWTSANTIIFATNDPTTGLMTVPGGGGVAKPLTQIDSAKGEQDHLFPSVLPNGRAVLFTIIPTSVPIDNSAIAVLDLKTGQRKTLFTGGTQPEYISPGYIVYRSASTLRAIRFDPDRLEVIGDAVPVIDQVSVSGSGSAEFAVAQNGTLVYLPGTGGVGTTVPRSLVWVTRDGHEEAIKAPARAYAVARLSPDGTRVALDIRDRGNDIWIWDVVRSTLSPLSFDSGVDQSPIWSHDGRRVIWSANNAGGGNPNLYWRAADGTGAVVRLTDNLVAMFANSASRDGTNVFIMGGTNSSASSFDISQIDLAKSVSDPKQPPKPLIHTEAQETDPEISPDGRWLAYASNKSGHSEIYVCPFPNIDGGLWTVSTAGGSRPAWSRDGRELFYLDSSNILTSVRVRVQGEAFVAGTPARILNTAYFPGATARGIPLRAYDPAPDGRRFLMIKESSGAGQSPAPSPAMTVVLNWNEELKTRVPAK
jgi:serine/threonine-protein kinase